MTSAHVGNRKYCRHMRAFAQALNSDENSGASDEVPSPQLLASPTLGAYPGGHRVRKVSALSDFAPVNQRVKRCVLPTLYAPLQEH